MKNLTLLLILALGLGACQKHELKSSQDSIDKVAKEVLSALQDNDLQTLQELRITEKEFKKIMWPELPARKNNVPYGFAWNNLNAQADEALAKILHNYGGLEFDYQSVYFKDSVETYPGFKVHPNSVLVVKDRVGNVREIRVFGSILERNGEFKVIGYVD